MTHSVDCVLEILYYWDGDRNGNKNRGCVRIETQPVGTWPDGANPVGMGDGVGIDRNNVEGCECSSLVHTEGQT